MPFILKIDPGVSKRIQNKTKKILDKLNELVDEPIKVFVKNKNFLIDENIECWGFIRTIVHGNAYKKNGVASEFDPEFFKFLRKILKTKPPEIHLAGKVRLEEFTETFLHEFAHYEQYANCKKIQERGVSLRAKSLKKKLKL